MSAGMGSVSRRGESEEGSPRRGVQGGGECEEATWKKERKRLKSRAGRSPLFYTLLAAREALRTIELDATARGKKEKLSKKKKLAKTNYLPIYQARARQRGAASARA